MSRLESLKSSKNLSDVAKILGFSPSSLAYILYKIKPDQKYKTFDIPKKNGGTRTINSPIDELSLLQLRLSELLYSCFHEIKGQYPRFWNSSHGFYPGRTIVSNAEMHRRRKFVFNVDIEDFFGTINFGRVRGFFIKDRAFSLDPPVATVIAQIACHENALPQGSPCSPVISNLVGNILDMRLLALARDARCTYTRYADDLTFSTNLNKFPIEIAENIEETSKNRFSQNWAVETIDNFLAKTLGFRVFGGSLEGGTWIVGEKLKEEIERAGFRLNHAKTRMSLKCSRQTVTGLVVNKKANINQDYYRHVRAMCNELFQRGNYYRSVIDTENEPELLDNLNPLEGMLSHINFVKARKDRPAKTNKRAREAGEFVVPKAPVELYRKFLFFKHFVVPKSPLIVTEGISDITYIRCAIRSLAADYPTLVEEEDGKAEIAINFLNPTGNSRDILKLGHGAGGQASLISNYTNNLKKYGFKQLAHPVIILCDNDAGPKTVFKNAKSKCDQDIALTTTNNFYYLGDNLYLIKVPEGSSRHRDMEDLFPIEWLEMKHEGKPFDRKKDHGDETAFGKVVFAEKIVRPNADKIDFSEFKSLLDRLSACIQHYKTLPKP